MDSEQKLPLSNPEQEMIELMQLSFMTLLKGSIGRTVVMPRKHLDVMKNFNVDVKVDDVNVTYTMKPIQN